MHQSRSRSKHLLASLPIYIVLIFLAIIMTYPFWYVLVMSFSTQSMVNNIGFILWPKGFTLHNVSYIMGFSTFSTSYSNTIYVVVLGTLLSTITTVLYAYPLVRKVPGTKFFNLLALFTMLFSGGIIPAFLLVRSLGLLNNLWSLILPMLINPFNLFIMRNFLGEIPESIQESAEIDGASPFVILFRIVLPLSMAGIATIALFYAVAQWNSYFDALIYMSKREKWTLQVLLREILVVAQADGGGATDATMNESMGMCMRLAATTTSIIPLILLYPFLQKYFVKGVTMGAVKG